VAESIIGEEVLNGHLGNLRNGEVALGTVRPADDVC